MDFPLLDDAQTSHDLSYLTGIIYRCTNQLLRCNSFEQLERVLVKLAEDLDLEACFRIVSSLYSVSTRVGDAPLSAIAKLTKCRGCGTKVCRGEGLVIINLDKVLFVAVPKTPSMGDLLQDTLVIFFESVQLWIENKESTESKLRMHNDYKNRVKQELAAHIGELERSQAILSEQREVSIQNLISQFGARLPAFGLEYDQEDFIMDTLSNTVDKFNECFDSQKTAEVDMLNFLHAIITYFEHDSVEEQEEEVDLEQIDSVTLF